MLFFFWTVFVPLGMKSARGVFRSHLTAYRNNPAFLPLKDVGVSYIFCGGNLIKKCTLIRERARVVFFFTVFERFQ